MLESREADNGLELMGSNAQFSPSKWNVTEIVADPAPWVYLTRRINLGPRPCGGGYDAARAFSQPVPGRLLAPMRVACLTAPAMPAILWANLVDYFGRVALNGQPESPIGRERVISIQFHCCNDGHVLVGPCCPGTCSG